MNLDTKLIWEAYKSKSDFEIEGNILLKYTGEDPVVTIPDGVTEIGNSAFYGRTSLTQIVIPNNVTKIGTYAFCNCPSLTQITIPNSVTRIGANAFAYCYSLTQITIPNSVTKIGNNAFSGCPSLTIFYQSPPKFNSAIYMIRGKEMSREEYYDRIKLLNIGGDSALDLLDV